MRVVRYPVEIVTNSGGFGIAFAQEDGGDAVISGWLRAISYVKDDTDPFADTVDVFVGFDTDADPAAWDEDNVTASKVVHPHRIACDQNGEDVNWVGGRPLYIPVLLYQNMIRIYVTGGGDTKRGVFHCYVEYNDRPFNIIGA